MFSMLQKIHLHAWISWFCEEEKLKRCSERECSDEADNLIWDLWCINSWISTVSADNKVHKKRKLVCELMRSQDVCEEYVLIWFSVSGGIQLRSTSLWLEVPVSTFGAGRLLYKQTQNELSASFFFLLMTPTQPHIAHALAKSSKEFKSVTNTCRSWCKKH